MHDHPLSPGGMTLAILDTCVLLPPRLSDVLFDLYGVGLFIPYWTKNIESEFLKNWDTVVKMSAPGSAQRRLDCFRSAAKNRYEIFGYDKPESIQKVPTEVDC